jgi:glycerate kinase
MTASVLIAPDKFKGTLSAKEVAEAIGAGLIANANVRIIPLADGGDGSIDAIAAAGFEVIKLDPSIESATGTPAKIARKGDVFFVESAEFCGLRHVSGTLDPLGANTLGIGQAVRAALDLGAATIVLGVGGTASTDGGVGFLMGLGAKFLTETGESIPLGGGGLFILAKVDFSDLDPRLAHTQIILASDVDSPLLGSTGAAKLFAPQKGADPLQVDVLELGLSRLVKVLKGGTKFWTERNRIASVAPGSGAGGGLGFAALLIGAIRVPGADYILDLLELDDVLPECELVITGEGALDEQSLAGKLPVALAMRARAMNIPVFAAVGTCRLSEEDSANAGILRVFALDQMDPRCATDSKLSLKLLTQIGSEIASLLKITFVHDY